jgi:hypothetical protein
VRISEKLWEELKLQSKLSARKLRVQDSNDEKDRWLGLAGLV